MAYRATGKLSLITYLDEEEIGTHTIPMDYTVPKYNLNDINLKITDETSYYKKIDDIPFTVRFSNRVKDLKNIGIGYRTEIEDLMKDVYRYVR